MKEGKFNTTVVRDYKLLTKENILAEVDETNMFEFYFGSEIDLKKKYINPLPGRADKNPGCKFFVGHSGKLLFIDFAKGLLCDVFGFVCEKEHVDLWGALNIINKDFRLGLGDPNNVYVPIIRTKNMSRIEQLKRTHLVCKKREWEFYDNCYWSRYHISRTTLEKFNVIPVEAVYKENRRIMTNKQHDPIYCYYFPVGNRKKIYRPLHPKPEFRFMSDPDIGITIQGWNQLPPNGNLLVITKSLKDVMCLYELGIPAIALHGEGYELRKDVVDALHDRFGFIVVLYDNDKTGIEAMDKINETLGLYCTSIPDYVGAKDVSDCIDKIGIPRTLQLLNQIIPDYDGKET